MSPADLASRAGDTPEASGDWSSGTFAKLNDSEDRYYRKPRILPKNLHRHAMPQRMIFRHSDIARDRSISQYPSNMNPEATRPQARIHGISDRQRTPANKAAQGIAGPSVVSMNTDFTFRPSGTGPAGRRAGRVPSLSTRPIHPLRQPAIAGL